MKLNRALCEQVIMEFPEAFWEGSVDYFGAAMPGGPAARGRCFMFWNLQRFAQRPILTAVVAGEAAEVCAEPSSTYCIDGETPVLSHSPRRHVLGTAAEAAEI